jgi:hypothetical protein
MTVVDSSKLVVYSIDGVERVGEELQTPKKKLLDNIR